jgi:hypothetical protein
MIEEKDIDDAIKTAEDILKDHKDEILTSKILRKISSYCSKESHSISLEYGVYLSLREARADFDIASDNVLNKYGDFAHWTNLGIKNLKVIKLQLQEEEPKRMRI